MSSFAQEESRTISENVKWGCRKKYSEGQVKVPFKFFLGYKRSKTGNLEVEEKQAKVIEYIYSLYILDVSILEICKYLEKYNVPTPQGKTKWHYRVVRDILLNEKYKGEALLQKSFTIDFLTRTKRKMKVSYHSIM